MINIDYIDCPYAVSKFEEHDNLKTVLLESIARIENSVLTDNDQNITNTDWHIGGYDKKQEYWNILYLPLIEHMKHVYKKLGFSEFSYINYWFQQYYKNSFHNWHVHGETSWTNIYYVELPNEEVKTNIKNQKTESIVIPNIEEGYILTMPAILWHCSPINFGDERKTVIVFNTTTPN